tara:strand:- start:5776 stop:6243 length:468 start_codon:yes stop_codon:yes gene_type:complete
MTHEEVSDSLRSLAFDFFYWFSRFEFALKEAGIRKSDVVGAKAEPDWNKFIVANRDAWQPTPAALKLIAENPKRQIIGEHGLDFREIEFNDQTSELERVVRLAQAVRNNLFHGGKHGSNFWDDPERMHHLLSTTIAVLDDLAQLGEIESDYRRLY